MTQHMNTDDWYFVCHLDYGDNGAACVIRQENNSIKVNTVDKGEATGLDSIKRPALLGIRREQSVILLDPVSKKVNYEKHLAVDAIAPYAYPDVNENIIWFMNDGDKQTGNDALNCGDNGSSVTIVRNENNKVQVLTTLCVGRGHHVTAFTEPTASQSQIPRRAFVSNLMDGTLSVIDNDPAAPTYLQVIDTINLCETDKEEHQEPVIPNNAFPHGMMFSQATGKIYSLNNGYHTIAVIDPVTNTIEKTFQLKTSSNLLLSPDGRFIIGKGVDRKADPDHVIGRLTVVDAVSGETADKIDLKDIYPSTYRFNADGTKLYVTSATTGKGVQKDNVRKDVLLIYDTKNLPDIELIHEIPVGIANCGRRPIAFLAHNGTDYVFVPNPTDGTISILNGDNEELIDTVKISDKPVVEFSFSFWDGKIIGC